ncbi:hypothetical protein N7466_008499 [Penicillium verhagenii]|uniref:uncharacterized protein n=1 Tax=Penicillium verhagenii TaxID=1562060 RepID=UPI00254587A6|nr:uncharacterized protein N7466_008499 [Penicillium verhagenii]KAJ5924312.1 hypothetical protein N7466_008499 [Penicillium verhagenii]
MPEAGDSLEVTASKLHGIADAIHKGGKFFMTNAEITNPPTRPCNLKEPSQITERMAICMMNPAEQAAYWQWKLKKVKLPVIDWVENSLDFYGRDSKRTFTLLATAIDLIWDIRGTTLQNACWISHHKPEVMDLVMAVKKLLIAQKKVNALQLLSTTLNESLNAEIQTLERVMATLYTNLGQELERVRVTVNTNFHQERERVLKSTKSIRESQALLTWRLDLLMKTRSVDAI